MKYNCIVSDPCWSFSDKLTMSEVKRGAEANYNVLSTRKLKELPVQLICEPSALLALWVPSTLLQDGLDVMKAWGFVYKTNWIWVKLKKQPDPTNLNNSLAFLMGRYFRASHEICLIGAKGKILNEIKNHSQRSVAIDTFDFDSVGFDQAKKHSEKTEILQDQLELMFPEGKFCELFGRRSRKGWTVLGNQSPDCLPNEDIFNSIERIKDL